MSDRSELENDSNPSTTVAIAFSGGLGIAAYHAGVYEGFVATGKPLHWVTGSSAGAITAAIIAGNAATDRLPRLRDLWCSPAPPFHEPGAFRHAFGWMAAIETRLGGRTGFFRPRLTAFGLSRFTSIYDLAPLRQRLADLIDFGRLNSGEPRVSIVATDLESGEPVIFDSDTVTITMDHVLASCGFLPEFAPVEVDGRLLGDGGLSLNVPFDPILEAARDGDLLLYVVDLFARDGERPSSLEAALERKSDLMFGNQTFIRLTYLAELHRLRKGAALRAGRDRIVLLSYRPGLEEAGPEKSFDFSRIAFGQRWMAGRCDMEYAQSLGSDELITKVRRPGR